MNDRILVVDDERGLREGCKRVLVPEGYLVESADSGEGGWALVKTIPYDLLLIDVMMPGMSGLDLLSRVLQHDPDLVCVVITGYATLETAVEATKRGAFDFLRKPFSPEELVNLVRKGLEKRRLSVEARRLREEREQNLLALATEQSRLRTVINAMSDGVLVVNLEGTLVLYNPAAVRLADFRRFPAVGSNVQDCLADSSLVEHIHVELSGSPPERSLISQETLVGQLTVLASIAPVRDERGQLLGAVVLLRDISHLKELDRLKSEFVSMVSHELKAPLSAIEGYLDTILAGYASDPEKQRRWLERSRERTSACLALIKDLLDLSRMETRKVQRQVEPLAVSEPVAEAVALLKGQADASQITVTTDLPADLPRIEGSREELSRLFTNLVSNAIKYNRRGGKVTIAGQTDGAYLKIAVTDTGIGIPAAALPNLFNEFYRVTTPETRYIAGTGLGLSIVKRIADAHQGQVTVQSLPGSGSTFAVFLPIPVAPHLQ
ncbi:MAG: response regulator [Candidatus Bathyarchaeota archaeon]|nr:response regulator [Candidatus Bathyarchaeota archaeon]